MSTTTPIDPVPRDLINVGGHAHRWLESLRRNLNSITGSGSGVDHGSLAGLSDDDHTHYSRADGTRAFTGVVGGIDPILSTHLATKNYVDTTTITDHTALTNIGVNTHAQIDTHIADSTIHFTEGSIDHGSISGLLDDDHTQYSLADGTRAFTGTVGGIDPTLSTHLTTKNYVDTEIANNTYWSRTSTTLSTKTANDDLQIDSFVRVNGSSDTQQLIIKGHSTQTANLQEWQDNTGTTVASVAVNGDITTTTGSFIAPTGGIQVDGNGGTYDFTGSFHAGSAKFQFTDNGVLAWWKSQGGYLVKFNNYAPAVTFHSAIAFNVTGNPYTRVLNNEVYLRAPATDTLAMYNGTTAQAFHIYNTYTDASNYERAVFDWQTTANTLRIGTEALGTGTVRPVELIGAGTTILGDASTDVPLTIKGASSQTANLQEWQDSLGTVIASVSSAGHITTTQGITVNGNGGVYDTLGSFNGGASKFQFFGNGVAARWRSQGGDMIHFSNYHAMTCQTGIAFNVTGNPYTGTLNNEAWLRVIDHDTLGMYDGAEAQAWQVYNTYTDASNYERAVIDWKTTPNVLTIGTEGAGTGTVRPIEIVGAGTTIFGDASTDIPLTVKGASGQTANLLELKNSAGKDRFTVSADGNLITLGRTDYQAWQGLHDTCTITTGVGGGNSTTACDLVIRPSSDSLLADTFIYAGHRLSNGGGAGNLTIGQEDFSGNASPAGMGTVLIRTGSMASQAGGSFDGGTLSITTGGGGGWGSVGTPAGAGGVFNVTLGDGKATSITGGVIGGAGGSFTLTGGDGGNSSGTGGIGGDGGSIVLTAGAKGTGTSADGVNGIIDLASTTKIKAMRETVANVSTSTTLTHTITYVRQTSSSITTTLWASPVNGDTIEIRNRGGGSNTIDGNGINIEGASTYTINDGDSICLVYDGIEWTI